MCNNLKKRLKGREKEIQIYVGRAGSKRNYIDKVIP
jgi:hypothetical protein